MLAFIDEADVNEALDLAKHAVELASKCGDPRAEFAARWLECRVLAEAGDLDAMAERLDRFEQTGKRTLLPVATTSASLARTCIALARGEVDSAVDHIAESLRLGSVLGLRSPVELATSQRVLAMFEQGRAREVLEAVGRGVPVRWTNLAVTAAAARVGEASLAAACLADLEHQLEPGPLHPVRGVVAALTVEAGALIGHGPLGRAEQILAARTGRWTCSPLTPSPSVRSTGIWRCAALQPVTTTVRWLWRRRL